MEQKKNGKKSTMESARPNVGLSNEVSAPQNRFVPIGQNYGASGISHAASQTPYSSDIVSKYAVPQTQPGYQQKSCLQGLENYPTIARKDDPFRYDNVSSGQDEYDPLAPPNLSNTTSSFDSSQVYVAPVTQMSKLPHGLTVQELKEMTKARLQAEASEKPCDSNPSRKMKMDPNCTVPVSLQYAQDYSHLSRHKSQSSPIPSGFSGVGRNVETREALDTASVGTSASDYANSESALSGANCFDESLASVPFSRSGSYPTNGSLYDYEWQPPAHDSEIVPQPPSYVLSSGSPYYEGIGGYAQNRRRAATLSPRPVGLVHLHEDRPLPMGNQLSSIQQTTMAQSLTQNRQQWHGQGRVKGSMEFRNDPIGSNRHRASSAVLVPSVSLSMDSISGEGGVYSLEPGQRFTGGFAMVQEAPSESLVTGLSSVFRASPDHGNLHGRFEDQFRDSALSSLGLGSSNSIIGAVAENSTIRKRSETDFVPTVLGFGASRSNDFPRANDSVDSRLRAATWGEPSLEMFGLNIFGGSDRIEKTEDDRLADDLASILRLSSVTSSEQNDKLFGPPGF